MKKIVILVVALVVIVIGCVYYKTLKTTDIVENTSFNEENVMDKEMAGIEDEIALENEENKIENKEEKNFLQVGEHILKFGKYETDAVQADNAYYGTIELRSNGTFHIKSNVDINLFPPEGIDCEGTYTYGEVENSFTASIGIYLKTEIGKTIYFEVRQDNLMSDQWHGYKYVGE